VVVSTPWAKERCTCRRCEDDSTSRYDEHLKRRNAMAHSGVTITRDEATASIEAVLHLRRWLLEIQGVDVEDTT
jgi:hypothetical protein